MNNSRTKALRYLKSNDFKFVKALGSGGHGFVIEMLDLQKKKSVAVKIVTKPFQKLIYWTDLSHTNIVPLLQTICLEDNIKIYIMPVFKTSLDLLVWNGVNNKNSDIYQWTKTWLYQAMCGLNYLHSKGLVHLDIKTNNILISDFWTAALCDFDTLSTFRQASSLSRKEMPSPYPYSPPEVLCEFQTFDQPYDGVKMDMWMFGVTALEIIGNQCLFNLYRSWKEHLEFVYVKWGFEHPPLVDIDKLKSTLENRLEYLKLTSLEIDTLVDFLNLFLRLQPSQRSPLPEAMNHIYLKSAVNPSKIIEDVPKSKASPMGDDDLLHVQKPEFFKLCSFISKISISDNPENPETKLETLVEEAEEAEDCVDPECVDSLMELETISMIPTNDNRGGDEQQPEYYPFMFKVLKDM